MNDTTEYPQGAAPVKNRKPLKIALAAFGAAVVLTGGTWGGIAYASGQAAAQAHTEAVAFQHAADAAMPRLKAQTIAAADESDTSTADQVVAAEQARKALAAVEQAAAAQAAKAQREASGGGCSAGSYADAYDDNGNATHCTPENGNGEVCQAYNDANQCTAWGKP